MSNSTLALCAIALVAACQTSTRDFATPCEAPSASTNRAPVHATVSAIDPALVLTSNTFRNLHCDTNESTMARPVSAANTASHVLDLAKAHGLQGESGQLDRIHAFTSSQQGVTTIAVELHLDLFGETASETLDGLMRDLAKLDDACGVSLDSTRPLGNRSGMHVSGLRVRFVPNTQPYQASAFDPCRAADRLRDTVRDAQANSSELSIRARLSSDTPGWVDLQWNVKSGRATVEIDQVDRLFSRLDELGTDVAVTGLTLRNAGEREGWTYSANVSYRTPVEEGERLPGA